MTTAAVLSSGVTSLEELVGRLIDALRWETAPTKQSGLVRGIHEVRRLQKQDDPDGALTLLASTDTSESTEAETRWAHSEWVVLVRRRFGDAGVPVYSPGTGQAAAPAAPPRVATSGFVRQCVCLSRLDRESWKPVHKTLLFRGRVRIMGMLIYPTSQGPV